MARRPRRKGRETESPLWGSAGVPQAASPPPKFLSPATQTMHPIAPPAPRLGTKREPGGPCPATRTRASRRGLSENMSALRHADLRRGRLRRNGMAASCGRPRASATQACVDFPATVPQAAWRRALTDSNRVHAAVAAGRRTLSAPPPTSRRCGVHAKRRRVMPNVPLVVTFVEVPEASGPPVAPPACVRGSTAGEIFSPPMQGGPPPDGQGRRAPKKRKSRPDACRRGRLSDRLEVIE